MHSGCFLTAGRSGGLHESRSEVLTITCRRDALPGDLMKFCRSLLLGSLLGSVSWHAAACYTVYDAANRIVYSAAEAPVDMSRPIHETLAQRFPGGQLVFDNASTCPQPAAAARSLAAEPSRKRKTSTVITELHSPPMTIVENADGVTISGLSR
jgi:hypothetical protein